MRLPVFFCVLAGLALTACPKPKDADTTADAVPPPVDTPAEVPAVTDETASAAKGAVGTAAADFTLTDYSGQTHTLSEYTADGKVVVLEWFSPKCGAVNAYYKTPEFFEAMSKEFEGKQVVWLAVNSSGEGKPGFDKAETEAWLAEHKKTTPVLADPTGVTGRAYGAEATPTLYVIDTAGRIAYKGSFDEASGGGDAPKGANHVVNAVNATLSGQPVPVTETRSVG